ncbi:MAG: NUDIX hydrolase, partial [Paracoccaceae bacterium]
ANVAVLGHLSAHETVTGFRVTPVVGQLKSTFTPVPEAGEVDEVFHVPLAFLADLANYTVEARRWNNQWRRYYTVPYGPYYIWGATARILYGLAERMQR